ncbi:sugar phosphate isomerase/epimerase family protein [Pseudomonas sp.]|uniref:sugar phosphate isomerase/epimerase family protein n=1 Tax=Pseudomonas sp. TaxID=306 RepID=UPI0028A6AD5E|nr:sugar phosphate isomerase/epimerase family protein [Pseudomonas sp.]
MPSPLLKGNPRFLNSVLLGGGTLANCRAARIAGFDQIELWRQDVEAFTADAPALGHALRSLELGLTDYQVLLDFDGAPDARRSEKRDEALEMLDTALDVGATTLLVPASTDADCNAERVDDDLRWLCAQAAQRGVRIAYESMAWSTRQATLPDAWACVQRVGADNLGLVVDAFHLFVGGRTLADLDGIPASRIFLVQLSDLARRVGQEDLVNVARHRRLLPGQGHFPLRALVERLEEMGYAGPVGLEVFNDRLRAGDPDEVALQAMNALRGVLG